MTKGRTAKALVLGALVLATAGCSKDEPENPFPGGDTLPSNTGSTCEDRPGDLSAETKSLGGNLSAPAGADIVKSEARLTDTTLNVSMTMAAPIIGTPDPDFVLAQGLANEESSFELHAEPTDATAQTWRLRLVRYAKDARGFVSQVPDTVLSTPVKVDGPTISYSVAQKDIPRVTSYVWQFGTSAKSADSAGRVLDVCDGAGAANAPTPSAPAGTTAPPPKLAGKLGETLKHNTGADVTVYKVESPPEAGNPNATPAQAGFKLAAADVQVCAPAASQLSSGARYFFIQDTENRLQPYKTDATVVPHESPLPPTLILEAGRCLRAWVTFQIYEAATPATVVYGTDMSGAGALRFELA